MANGEGRLSWLEVDPDSIRVSTRKKPKTALEKAQIRIKDEEKAAQFCSHATTQEEYAKYRQSFRRS